MEVGTPISTIIVYVGLAIIAVCLIYSIYLCLGKNKKGNRLERERKTTTIDAAKVPQRSTSVTKTDDKSTPVSVENHMTCDQLYADTHGMWICMYCETINSYPDGYIPRKQSEYEEKIAVSSSSSGLRGDLLNKSNKRHAKHPLGSTCLLCVACGKSQ